jgi:hypothetical protein
VRPRLLLIPAFTELQWTIKPLLEEWAEVASYDSPGVGDERLPASLDLAAWRRAGVERGLAEVDGRGWERFFVVTDGEGVPTGVRLARARPEAVRGLAIGHAALARTMEGDRPAVNREVWAGMGALLRTDRSAFIRYGLYQVTAGSLSEEVAGRVVERFPDSDLATRVWDGLGTDPEPIGDDLSALGLPMLFAEHAGCLGSTPEGFEDIVAAFPEAATVTCEHAPATSPEYAQALREFCGG